MEKAKIGRRFRPIDEKSNNLIDILARKLETPSSTHLAERLKMSCSAISKIRHRVTTIGPDFLIRVHEETDMSIQEVREMILASDQADILYCYKDYLAKKDSE